MTEYEKIKKKARKDFLRIIKESENEIYDLFENVAASIEKDKRKISDRAALILLINNLFKKINKDLYTSLQKNIEDVISVYGNIDIDYFSLITDDERILNTIKNYSEENKKDVMNKIIKGILYVEMVTLKTRCNRACKRTINLIKKYINNSSKKEPISDVVKNTIQYINPNIKDKKISFNYLRIARTTLVHTMREIIVENCKDNIFCIGVLWELSPDHYERVPNGDECDDYADSDMYGLGIGIFPIDEVPMQHYGCLCNLSEVDIGMDEIGDRIDAWIDGDDDSDIDEWIEENL